MVVRLSDWARTLCWNLNCLSRQKCLMILMQLKWLTEDYTGFKSPEEGMSEALRTINIAFVRKKNESWNVVDFPYSYVLHQDDLLQTIEDKHGSSPAELEAEGKKRGKGRKSPRWRQRKCQREQRASSSTVVPVQQYSGSSPE